MGLRKDHRHWDRVFWHYWQCKGKGPGQARVSQWVIGVIGQLTNDLESSPDQHPLHWIAALRPSQARWSLSRSSLHHTWSCLLPCCWLWASSNSYSTHTDTALNKPKEGSTLPLQFGPACEYCQITFDTWGHLQNCTTALLFLHTFTKCHTSNYGTAYHVNDIAIWLIIIGFFAHTRNFHACLQGDKGDEFLVSSEQLCLETIGGKLRAGTHPGMQIWLQVRACGVDGNSSY